MHRRAAVPFGLAFIIIIAGCGGGGGGGGGRSTIGGVNSASTGFVVTQSPVADTARMTNDVPALAFSLQANGVSAVFSSVTLQASGSVDEAQAIGAVRLVGDDNKDGRFNAGEPVLATRTAPAFATNDGTVTLTLAAPITIAAGGALDLLVVVDASAIGATARGRIGQTVVLSLASAAAIEATPAPNGNYPLEDTVALELGDHVLMTEVVADPAAAEFVELFNPTGRAIDLSTIYITDADDLATTKTVEYYFLPRGSGYGPSNTTADFLVRFPAGATLPPGATVVMATDGAGFMATYGRAANYCTRNPAGGAVQMLTSPGANGTWSPTPTGTSASIFPDGEPLVVFTWDGVSDLVQDIDAIYLGPKSTSAPNDPHDKTGVMVDGPDADTTPSVYLADTPAAQQANVTGDILQRIDFSEGAERLSGGNGVTGNDETSEPVNVTWVTATTATPGTP